MNGAHIAHNARNASTRCLVLLALAVVLAIAPFDASVHAQEDTPPPPGNLQLLNLMAWPGHQQVTLTWDEASDAEKARITKYQIQQGTSHSAMMASAWKDIAGSDSSTMAHVVTGLGKGTFYYFSVRATGPGGAGLASPPVSATTLLPGVTNLAITSSPKSGDTYRAGEQVEVTVTFIEAVTVTGVPFLQLNIGDIVQHADYASGSGTKELVFAHTVEARDKDADGVSIPKNPIILASSDPDVTTDVDIRTTAGGLATNPNHAGLVNQSSHKVDGSTAPPTAASGAGPTITGMSIASSPTKDGTYSANEKIVVEVSWSARVRGFGDPEPTLNLTIGSSTSNVTVQADFVRHVVDTTTFSYKVKSGDVDTDGVSIPSNPINLSSHHYIRGDDNKNAVLTYTGLADQSSHKVNGAADTAGPTITGLYMFSDGGPYKTGDVIAVGVSFSETIVVTGTPTLKVTIGDADTTFSYAKKSHITGAAVFEYTVLSTDADTDGVSVPENSVTVPMGASITDAAGNDAVVTHAALPAQEDHTVPGADTTAPTITGLSMFSKLTGKSEDELFYEAGNTIAVRVAFSERIVVTGTPTLDVEIGANTRTFSYVAYVGVRDAATFEYTVQAGDSDQDGVSIGADAVKLPAGASIKDEAGNNAVLTHNAVSAQPGHKVGEPPPVGGL